MNKWAGFFYFTKDFQSVQAAPLLNKVQHEDARMGVLGNREAISWSRNPPLHHTKKYVYTN